MTSQHSLARAVSVAAALLLAACGSGGGGVPLDGNPAPLFGRVTKVRGTPIPGATVRLVEDNKTVTTDSSGRFRIDTDYRGTGTLEVSMPQYAPLRVQVLVGDGVEKLVWLVRPQDYDSSLAWKIFWLVTDMPDPPAPRWAGPVIVYTVDRSPPWNSALDPLLKQAEQYWHLVTAGAYRLQEGSSPHYILVKASDNPCNLGYAEGCVSRASWNETDGIVLAEIQLRPSASLAAVVHEFMHALGFGGHSDRPGDLMYTVGSYPGSDEEAAIFCVRYANPVYVTFSQIQIPNPPRCSP